MNTAVRIDALGRDNYDTWKMQVRALLVKNDAWGYVSGEIAKPEPAEGNADAVRDWNVKDEKAKSDLILSISAVQLKLIKKCVTSREVWIKLENTFQSKGPARKATLLKSLTLQKMSEGGDVREHLHDFFDAVDKLADMDVNINPDQLAIMMLYSLPSSFENFRIAIESRDLLPAPENLRTKIVEEFDARRAATSSPVQGAMYANKKPVNKRKPKDSYRNRDESYKIRCFKCHEKGHKASECRSRKTTDKYPSVSFLATEVKHDACHAASGAAENQWCLDSGCTSHLCVDASLFKKIDNNGSGKLKLASNATAEIKSKGVAEISTRMSGKRCSVTLTDALHVPELRTNLLSVSKITDKGYRVTFERGEATVVDEQGSIKLVAKRRDNLYYVEGAPFDDCRNAVVQTGEPALSSDSTQIWHRRMGHLNFRDLVRASESGAIRGISLKSGHEDQDCDICIRGKMTRPPFPKESNRQTEKLGLIHTDVCGPMRVSSKGGSRYFVTFTDDRTRWTEVRFIQNKSQVLEEFRAYKVFVEKQHDAKIKGIQSDNGREYANREFDEFLKSQGIQRRFSAAYTPEQNGVAERKNRTLVEAARCLLLQSGLPPSFWAEAISTANYVRNRCPTKRLDGRTPYEFWRGGAPKVSYFKQFGCKVFCLDRGPTRGKFDARSREGVFIGYSEESKGFRVWLPESRKVKVTRDVKFLEEDLGTSRTPFEDFCSDDASRDKSIDHRGTVVGLDIEWTSRHPESGEDVEVPRGTPVEPDMAGDQHVEALPARTRGRPRIVRTGRPGRPRKVYGGEGRRSAETAGIAEVPVRQAISGTDSSAWKSAMASEVRSLIRNDTWALVERQKGQRVIGSRFVLRNKYNSDGTIERRKARLVARGFAQRPGVDFHDTFAPVARLSSIRMAVALAVERDMKIRQIDIGTAYLNGDVEEQVLMEVPEHFGIILEHIVQDGPDDDQVKREAEEMLTRLRKGNVICSLNKALYGLRQAGRAWHRRLDKELRELGAIPSEADPCVYYIGPGESRCFIIIYVDDILFISRDENQVKELVMHLNTKFDVKDLGDIAYCLGLEFKRNENSMSVSQGGYVDDILERFGMSDCKPVSTPIDPGIKLTKEEVQTDDVREDVPYRELVGALMYLSVATRPDIAHAVSCLSQFNDCHAEVHWRAAKRVLRYLKGTRDMGLVYSRFRDPPVLYADADWGGCHVDRKSYTGYVFIVGGTAVSWESRKQQTVALSSTEAEYMALSDGSKEALYMRRLLKTFGVDLEGIVVRNDNMGAQKLASNPVYHSRTKHIDVRHHFVRDAVEKKLVSIQYASTDEMTADILTKGLQRVKHENCVRLLGLKPIHS